MTEMSSLSTTRSIPAAQWLKQQDWQKRMAPGAFIRSLSTQYFHIKAVDKLAASPITHLITTNTVPIPPSDLKTLKKNRTVDILDIAPLLGEVIRRAHEGRSVGEMFDE